MSNNVPEWALKRAQELRSKRGFTYLDAFAAYIAEHEQPPIDRKVLCAREAEKEWSDNFNATTEWLAIRAIELYEEGFGK